MAIKHSDLPVSECHALNADSVTTGNVALEYGGLNANISAYDGVLRVTSGTASDVPIYTQDSTGIVTVGHSLRLYNKGFGDDCWFYDEADTTKKMLFDVSGITTDSIRTITMIDTNFTIMGLNTSQTVTNKRMSGSDNTFSNLAVSSLSGISDSTNLLTTEGVLGGASKKVVTSSDTVITVEQFRSGYVELDANADSIDVNLPSAGSFGALAECLFLVTDNTHDIDITTGGTGAQYYGLLESDSTSVRDSVLTTLKTGATFILKCTGNTSTDTVQWLIIGGYQIDLTDSN